MSRSLSLVVRRTIRAPAERLFRAWTEPEQLQRWWGPPGVQCPEATIDLRPGGGYRIANQLPDGRRLYFTGEFRQITPPHRLVYTWRREPGNDDHEELVTVRFDALGPAETEVVVVHERIVTESIRDSHERGWQGCLEGLAGLLET